MFASVNVIISILYKSLCIIIVIVVIIAFWLIN